MPKPDVTHTAACLNKNEGKKSYFVIHGTNFANNATVMVKTHGSGEDWDPKIKFQDTTKIVVKVKAPKIIRAPKPKDIETLDITVTNPDTGEFEKETMPIESVDEANP